MIPTTPADRDRLLATLATLPASQRAAVLVAAQTLRAARAAGDKRPAAEIVAWLVSARGPAARVL